MQDTAMPNVSREPLSILFNPGGISKRNVWDIDLLAILGMLARVLERGGSGDLRMAGIAALSSALIYRMKVESIFALQKEAMAKRAPPKRERADVDIDTIRMPYRHQTAHAVTLDELLGTLQSLVVSLANPRTRRPGRLGAEPAEEPDMRAHLLSLESVIKRYQDLILGKLRSAGRAKLQDMVSGLDSLDSIRCFFAALFLARDGTIALEEDGEDVVVVLLEGRTAANRGPEGSV